MHSGIISTSLICICVYILGNTTICNYLQTFNCAQYAIAAFTVTRKVGGPCNCPLQCNSKLYSLTISGHLLQSFRKPGHRFLPFNECLHVQTVHQRKLSRPSNLLQFHAVPGHPHGPWILLHGVAERHRGAFGLLLGSTVFTFLEIFEFLWEISYYYFSTRNKDSQVSEKKVIPVVACKNRIESHSEL